MFGALRGGSPPFPPVGAVVLTSGTTGTPKAVELATSGLAAGAPTAATVQGTAYVGWWTAGASWLTGDPRARLLWVLLVGAGGLVGWSYAAVVTFAAGFGATAQLILAYTGGGLPFALAAGLLLRPWRANVLAGAMCAGLVAAGFLMVAGGPTPQNVFALYAEYARSFLNGGSQPFLFY